MKNTIMICCSLFFFGMATSNLKAQTQLEKNKYSVLSTNIQQLPAILQTATALENEDGELFGEFQVIFCGKTLQNIPQNQEFAALLKTAKKQGVKIFACGISLTKFNLSKKDVPPGLRITENGILHAFQLQKQGFLTLSI